MQGKSMYSFEISEYEVRKLISDKQENDLARELHRISTLRASELPGAISEHSPLVKEKES